MRTASYLVGKGSITYEILVNIAQRHFNQLSVNTFILKVKNFLNNNKLFYAFTFSKPTEKLRLC